MRYLIIPLFVFSITAFGQANYSENLTVTKLMFETSFSQNSEVVFIMGAKENKRLEIVLVSEPEKLKVMLEEVFLASNCSRCELQDEFNSENPIPEIFEVIQENEVYIIERKESHYLVKRFSEI